MQRKRMIERVEAILEELGLPCEQNVSFNWMTNRVPMEKGDPAPPRVRYRLMAIHARLGGDLSALERKRRTPLRFDFLIEDKTLVEVESRAHFSSHRMSTLEFYDGLDHNLDVDLYRKLCSRFSDIQNEGSRDATDFPFPGGRSAQRAYFDAVKDLLVPAHDYRLIRLPAADEELIENIPLSLRVLV